MKGQRERLKTPKMHIQSKILEHFGLSGQQPVSLSGKIDRTLCWRFTTNAGDALLVATQRDEKSESVKQKLRLGCLLAAFGAPVDTPCSADDLIEEDGRIWYLTSYDGEPKSTWDDLDFVRAGETLAHFHTAGERLNEQRRPPRGHLNGFREKARLSAPRLRRAAAKPATTARAAKSASRGSIG